GEQRGWGPAGRWLATARVPHRRVDHPVGAEYRPLGSEILRQQRLRARPAVHDVTDAPGAQQRERFGVGELSDADALAREPADWRRRRARPVQTSDVAVDPS